MIAAAAHIGPSCEDRSQGANVKLWSRVAQGLCLQAFTALVTTNYFIRTVLMASAHIRLARNRKRILSRGPDGPISTELSI
jgi:hypothetical protein